MFALPALSALMSLRTALIAGSVAFLLGVGSGGWAVYKIWDYASLKAEARANRERLISIAKTLKVVEDTNTDDMKAEELNDRITQALLSQPAEPAAPVASANDCPADPAVFDADGMRLLQQLQ